MNIPNIITRVFLDQIPLYFFVFGDNLIRKGKGGAAALRDHPQSYGFITKKYPNNKDSSFYKPDEYLPIFKSELSKLIKLIESNPNKIFLISKLGSGLANKYKIFQTIINPGLQILRKYKNVKFLF